MEKKEVRLKCTGCGTTFKLKVPVTDKPLTFTCKKCQKVMKIRLQASAKTEGATASRSAPETGPLIERGQQSELEEFEDLASMGLAPGKTPTSPAVADVPSLAAGTAVSPEAEGRWVALIDNMVRGPFSDTQVVAMINDGEINTGTSIRLGERPWIQVAKVPQFAAHLRRVGAGGAEKEGEGDDDSAPRPGADLRVLLSWVLPYPFGRGNIMPLVIFAGIAVVLFALLCLDFTIGLAVNVVGWMLLYGYLERLLRESMTAPGNPPPAWNFARVGEMVPRGAKVFVVLLVYSLLPVTIMLLVMIAGFLNGMTLVGYAFMLLTVLVFAGSMLVAPAALVNLAASRSLGRALNPGAAVGLVRKGGSAYRNLAVISLTAGIACMMVTLLGVFLVDIPIAGFLVAALLMGGVFSYGHFLWFYLVGRFSAAHKGLAAPAASPA